MCLYFLDRTSEEQTRNGGERGEMTGSKEPQVELNPWPLWQGQSLCIWDAPTPLILNARLLKTEIHPHKKYNRSLSRTDLHEFPHVVMAL